MGDDSLDELADVAAYLVGRCEHIARLGAVTSDPAALATYLLAAYEGAAPVIDRPPGRVSTERRCGWGPQASPGRAMTVFMIREKTTA